MDLLAVPGSIRKGQPAYDASSPGDSGDFARSGLPAPQQPLQGNIRSPGQVTDPLSLLQLLPDLLGPNAGMHPCDDKMLEHISALSDEADAVTCHGLDQTLDRFLTELLSHSRGSPSQQAS